MAFVTLDEHSYVFCPQCGFAVSFLQGQESAPQTKTIEVFLETVVTLVCPTDGKFEVLAGEFRNSPPDTTQV
jgi:hypothetical protein